MATEHVDRCGYEYLDENHFSVVVCSLEHGLDQLHSLCASVAPSMELILFFFYTAAEVLTFASYEVLCKVKGNSFTNHN